MPICVCCESWAMCSYRPGAGDSSMPAAGPGRPVAQQIRRPGPVNRGHPIRPPRRGSCRWDDNTLDLRADVGDRGRFQGLLLALGGPAPRLGIMPPPQLDHHFLRRLVLHCSKFLQHRQPAGLQLVLGQVRRRSTSAKIARPWADSRPPWRRCSLYGRARPTRSVPRPGCRSRE